MGQKYYENLLRTHGDIGKNCFGANIKDIGKIYSRYQGYWLQCIANVLYIGNDFVSNILFCSVLHPMSLISETKCSDIKDIGYNFVADIKDIGYSL